MIIILAPTLTHTNSHSQVHMLKPKLIQWSYFSQIHALSQIHVYGIWVYLQLQVNAENVASNALSKHSLRLKLSLRSSQTYTEHKATLQSTLVVTLKLVSHTGALWLQRQATWEHKTSIKYHLVPVWLVLADVKLKKTSFLLLVRWLIDWLIRSFIQEILIKCLQGTRYCASTRNIMIMRQVKSLLSWNLPSGGRNGLGWWEDRSK